MLPWWRRIVALQWLEDCGDVQLAATKLLYAQVFTTAAAAAATAAATMTATEAVIDCRTSPQLACGTAASAGPWYTGAAAADLAAALFALVALESGSQALGRTYAALLLPATLLLDAAWFATFSRAAWPNYAVGLRHSHGSGGGDSWLEVLSLKVLLLAQAAGAALRLASALLWWQLYRLGASAGAPYALLDLENSGASWQLFTPDRGASSSRRHSLSSAADVLGGSIYNPAAYATSLFEASYQQYSEPQDGSKDGDEFSDGVEKHGSGKEAPP
eukprot:SM000092S24533  [mRNA]  locus=s92:504803:505915:- [translate_table: standard]